jgi:hypothetical protein
VAIVTDDALRLARHVGTAGADLIITSPPYGGTYDYIDHHADRLAFLGLDDRALDRGELFARRRPSRQAFDDDTRALLGALAASLAPPGLCVLVVGDGLVERGGRPELVDAARQLEALAPAAGLALLAVASAPRADFYREGAERHEHLVVLAHR